MIAKVIATSFAPGREVRTESYYPFHNQTVTKPEEILTMLRYVVENESDGGMPFDTVIVSNAYGYEEGNRYLMDLDGKKSKNGKFRVLFRDNRGGSFGAYNYAFENTDYDGYLFTEDDIVVFGPDYMRKIYDGFNSEINCGFLALVGIDPSRGHAHGGVGYTTRKILSQVHKKIGRLPYYAGDWEKEKVIEGGETRFTKEINSFGYETKYLGTDTWDERNLCLPYWNLCKESQ